jgi:hypothetical protein
VSVWRWLDLRLAVQRSGPVEDEGPRVDVIDLLADRREPNG